MQRIPGNRPPSMEYSLFSGYPPWMQQAGFHRYKSKYGKILVLIDREWTAKIPSLCANAGERVISHRAEACAQGVSIRRFPGGANLYGTRIQSA